VIPQRSILPEGVLTFVLTDIVDSVGMWDRDPTSMARALVRHDSILHGEITRHRGHIFGTAGDAFAAAFGCSKAAFDAATAIQLRMRREEWPAATSVSVRIALHSGDALERAGNYYGPPVNVAARLTAMANGGQVLMSSATKELLDLDPAGVPNFVYLGPQRLRGIGLPVSVWGTASWGITRPAPATRAACFVGGNWTPTSISLDAQHQEPISVATC
jgi:class 3 adenylate cyclase